MTEPDDLRSVLRRGRRVGSSNVVVHVLQRGSAQPVRFGFIVSKAVGGAVARNLVRRRMRAASRDILSEIEPGTDVVVRALPGSGEARWGTLQAEIAEGVKRGMASPARRAERSGNGSSPDASPREAGASE